MAYNGSGSFTIDTAGNPVVTGTSIASTVHNTTMQEIATGLSTAICKDGQTTVTQNIPMASHKFTGLSDGSARTDSANIGNIVDGTGVYVATVGGTADVITLTPNPAIAAYAAGQTFRFIASGANTTNVTVEVSGLAAKAITKNGTTALVAGDIPSGMMVEITYDGTRFILGTTGAASFVTTANHPTITADTTITVSDARTNTVDVPLTITSTTSNTPAAGIGTGILLRAESADENPSDFGRIEAAASDVGAGTEDTYFQLLTRVAGATLTATYRFIATAVNKAIFTHANTADRTYTFPDATGNVPVVASQAEVTAMTSATTALTPNHNLMVIGTAIPTTSGTSNDFTGIPAGVREIVVTGESVSTNGTDELMLQLGDAGGIETSGYSGSTENSAGTATTHSSGFLLNVATIAAGNYKFTVILTRTDATAHAWSAAITCARADSGGVTVGAGSKTLSAEIDRVRLTTLAGANTFDAGSFNVTYAR